MTNQETVDTIKKRKRSRAQVMNDLEKVNDVLDKLDDWSSSENDEDPIQNDHRQELPTVKPSKFSLDRFSSLSRKTGISASRLDKFIESMESMVQIQIKHCCMMLINQIQNDQLQLPLRMVIGQKKSYQDLLRIYNLLKPIAILELSGPTDGLTMLLPFLLGSKL